MANLIRVIADTSNAQTWQAIDVTPGMGEKGRPARLKAISGAKYQVQDLSNQNQGPKNLRTQRVGKNLHVIMGEGVAPDLIVEGYFDEVNLIDAKQGLYGMSPEGQLLAYATDASTLANVTQSGSLISAASTQSALSGSAVTDFAVTSAATPLAVKTGVVLFGGVVGTKGAVQGAENSGAKAAKALAGIAEFAQTNTQGLAQAQGVVPDAATYLAAGVTGVDASNIGFINDSLATAAVDGAAANTQPKLQAIANACRAIFAAAQGPAGSTASVSAADFTIVGVTGVDSATKVALLGNLLSGSGAAAANSVAKLQVLSDAVAAVMAAAAGGLAPTLAQLQALGMDVTADNLAAVQAAIAATADDGSGVSTRAGLNAVIAAGQAALNKIEAFNNGNGTTSAALTLQDYADAGVTGVTPDNLVAVNAKVLAAATGGANSSLEIQALVQAADAAIAEIEAFNNGNGTTPAALTLQDYADAGVSGVTSDNLAAVNAKVLAAASGGANSVAEIQDLVSAGNAALKKIEAYNNGNGAIPLPLTATDYVAAGIAGVDEVNITAVNARVLAAATGGADTVPEIQALVAGIQAAVDKIEAYNNGNGTTPSAMTLQDYVDAGVTGVTADNLVAVNAKVLAAATGGANSSLEIQALVQAADAAIAKIEAFNNGDGTTPAPLSVADYAAAGITGVTADNVAAMNATVLAKNLGETDTPVKVQALLAAADAALNKIEAYNNGNGSTPAALTLQDYANAGVSGVSTDNLAAVNAKVLSAATGGANSGTEIQALVNAGNEALNKIEAYNNGDGTTPVALTLQDYADAGITGVSNDNLAALNATVLVQVAGGANTVARVQSLVGIVNAALSKIEAYNNGNGTTPAPLSLQDYALAGVSGVSAENLVAVNAKVLAAATGGANSAAEIQALVQAANSALAKIEAYNNGDGTTPAPLSVADYQAAGITGVNPSNLAALNAQVVAQSAGGAHTAPQVQNLVSVARAALAKIEAYNNGDGLEPPALAVQDYAAVGVTGVSADNLAAVNAQVLAASLGGAQDVRDIQTLVTAGNAALAKIEAFNNGNGSTPPALALSDYQAAGITGVSADNLAAVNAKVLAAATGGANTVAKVQTLVTAGNLALNKIEAYNNGDGTTPAALTAQDYADAGVTGVSDDNVAAVNAQVLRASMGGANTVSEVQSLVAQANAALATIEAFNNGNGSTPPSLALSDYQAAGITGVSADNLAAVNAKVLAAATGGANTVAKVQTLVTAGNLALNKIEAFNNGDGTTPAALTAQDYADAGLADVTPDNVVAVNANVLAAVRGGAATVAQVQALVAVAVEAIAKVERYNNGDGSSPSALSVADYVGAGVRGVSADNLAAVNARVLASGVGDTNTPAQIQAFADAVNTALDKVEAYNNGNGTTPAALTAQDYANAGMANVTVHNVAAVNAQVLAQAVGGAHTISAISALVTAANNAIAKVEAFNNGNGTTPAPLSVQDYVNAGVSGVNDGNVFSVNARVLAAAVGGADTSPKIQNVANAVNAALDKIEAYNQGNGSVPAALVLQDYVDAGIGGVSADNVVAVNAQVLAQNIGGAHNSLQLNTLVDAANAALAKIEAYNNGNGTTPAALTVADFEAAGITGVSDNNVASVNAKVLAAIPGATNSVNEVQNLVNALNLGLVKIEAYNRGDGTTPSALTTQDYADAGIAGVSSDNLAAVNAQVLRQNDGGADTVFKVQNLVTLADAALAKIEAYNNGNGTTPAALSVADYEAAGVTGVSVQNLASVNAKVLAAGMGGANSVDKIQAFANGVNYALVKIEAYNNGDGVTPSALSIQDYEAAGVSGVSANNLAAVNAQVLAVAATGADTPGEVQALVTAANSALAKIEAYNSDTPTPLALTLADYAAAGIGGVSVDNLAAVNAQVLAATQGAADSVGDIEYLVSLASDALAKIEAYNNGNGTTPTALTLQDYDAAGITGVTAANLAAVNAQVLAKSPLGADTVGEVQAIVLEANTAIDKIEAYNNGNGTTPAALVAADYVAAGVTGVNADNLAIINAKVLAAAAGASDTGPKIQSFADGVNNALVKIEAYNNGDGVTPVALTLQDFAAAGISGVIDANLAAVNAQVRAAAPGGANTVSKVQALVTGAGHALAKIEDYNNGNGTAPVALTVPDYEAAGVTGVNSDNVAAVNTRVLAQDIGGADSVLKVQALADAVNLSIAKIEAYNNGNGITPVALTVQDYAVLGLTTVTVGNVAAVNAQVLAKPVGGANSVAEIQACVTAGIAAVAKIEDYNNGNGTTPAALVAQDYADAGITGVNTDNLAAVNARVLAAATGAADTVAEIQAFANATLAAIAKIEAYNNGNGITPVALTITDYEAAGVSNVSAGNLAAVNAQVLAQGVDGANAVAEIQACVAAGIAAIAKVEAYNNGNGTSPAALTVADYAAAGVTGVTPDNVAAVNAKVLAASTGATETVAKIQSFATALNTALDKIEAYNSGNGTSPSALTEQDYAQAGIAGVDASNVAAVNAQVLAQAVGGARSVAAISALVVAANNALAKIEAYNNGNGTTLAALAVADYQAAGITGVSTDNVAAVNARVLAANPGAADTVAEIQALASAVSTALAKMEAYNNGDGTTPAALSVADYAAVGITVTADNLAAVNAKVLSATIGGADTVSEVQALVTAAVNALANIEAYNNGNGTAPAALLVTDYTTAGITGVNADNLAAVNAKVLAQIPGGADTAPKVQALVNGINTALAKIEAYNNGDGVTPAALTAADYSAAGISGVSDANVAAVNATVLAAAIGSADSVSDVQALVAAAAIALNKIEAYNNGNGTTPSALMAQDYADAGITGVTNNNVAAVNAQVLAASAGGADTSFEVQGLVSAANSALAKIEAYNDGNGTIPSALSLADYQAAGISGVSADNLAAVNAQVLAAVSGAANTVPEINALVVLADAALAKIEAYNNGNGTTPAALSVSDYEAAGITGVNADGVAVINAKVLNLTAGGANTVPKVQAIADGVNTALAKIEAYNNGNGTTPAALTAQDYADAGIANVTADNVVAVNAQVLDQATGGANSVSEVQALVAVAIAALNKIEAYNNGDGTIPAALTQSDYEAAGITGVTNNNLAAVNAQVLAAAVGEANSVSEVQALVTAGNNALAKIEAYNNGNGTNPAALTAQDYAAAGITGVRAGNVVAVNAKVLAAATSGADTVGEVQALVNAANSALAKIEAYNNGNGTTPSALSVTDYDVIGVTGVTANNVAAVNAQVLAQNSGGANSVPAIQALVSTANAALAKIEAYNNGNGSSPSALTVADFVAAGITGVTLDNVAAVNVQVLAQSTGGADTVPDIQALIVGANTALAKIAAYSDGNGTTPAALTQSDYEAAGITGVSAANLLAVNAKVLGQLTGGADSVPEIQGCVDFALSALAKIEAYNNGNGLTPAALIDQDYLDAAVQGVSADNLAAVNAQVLAAASGGANSVSQVQALVTAGNNALAKIEAYNNGNGNTPAALTVQDYEAAGITGVNSGNVAAVNAGVLAANPGEANTVAEIQTWVSGAGYALAKIEAYNNGDGSSPVALTVADYQAAGITGVSSTNVAAVNAQVLASAPGGATSVAQVQALVSAGNAALAKIEAYNNGNGSTPAALAVADYVAAGITGVNANNVAAVNAQVLAAASGGADNVPKVQTLVLAGNAALAKIEAYNNGDGTTPAALTEADYAAAGITDVIANNLVAVNAQVLARAAGGANTAPQVQALVVAANAALAKIEAYNNGNGTTPAGLVEADYQAVGVTGVTADNLAAVNAKVVAASSGGADTVAEIQAIANGVTQALVKIEAYNNGNGSSPSALSVADYEAAGITGVSADNLLAVNAQVLGAATGGADSVSDVQAWVTVATNAMAALAQAAQNNTAVSSQLAPANFAAVGVTGVSQGNVGALQSVLDSAAVVGTSVDSVAKIQAIVNAYQAIVLNADGTANNNATHPSQAQYALMGVTGVNSAVKESLLGDVVDSQSFANVDAVAKLQTLVAKVQNVMDVAALDNTHTFFVGNTPDGSGNTEITALRASLEALGLTGLNAQNMGAVWMSVRDSANAGTGVDTLSKLQTLINAANDQPTVLNVNVAISTLEDTPAVFKIADALASHISDADSTGVKGIAISWNQTSTAQGTWAYSSDNVTWTDLPVYLSQGNSITNALYLNATDSLRYTPLAHKNGAPGNLFFRAVDASFADTTSGTTGFDVSDYNKTGQSMTDGPLYFVLNVTAVNDAPVLADTVLTLTAVAEDAAAPVGAVGNLVSSLTNGVSDVDGVSVPKGIAITATNTSQGTLFYSTDAGVTWTSVGVVSTSSALLLANDANTRLYFQPSANFNGTVTDVLTFVAWDQTSGSAGTKASTALKGGATAFSTASDTVAFTVTAVNDAPVIDTTANNFTIVEDSSTSFIIRDQLVGKISDIDGTDLKGIAIAQNTSTNGIWAWSTDGVSWTNFPSTYLGTLDWTQLLYLNATDRLRFTPNANANGTGLGALNFVAVDSSFANTSSGTQISGSGIQGGSGALSSQSGYFTVDVTAVNDAPTHTVPGAQTTNEDTAKVISGLQIADVDAGSSTVTVTLSVANGTLTVLTGTGVTLVTNATASVTLTGTVSAINTLLATASAVTYTPTTNYNGSDTLTMTTNDGGNAGSGGALSATSTVALTITPVNDAPVRVADTTFTLLEDTATSYTVSAMVAGTFTDVEGSAAKGVMIGWAPSNASTQGVWAYSSNGGTTWTDFPSDLNGASPVSATTLYLNASDSVRYTPASNATGNAGYLNLRVVDGAVAASITSGSRVNDNTYLATADSVYVTAQMTAINDAPTLSVTTSTPTFTEGGTSAQSLQGTAVSLFSGATSATGPSNESSQKLTSLQVTVSGLADGANEILTVNGTDVALTQGTSGTNANGTGYSVSVTGSTATITVTPTAGSASSVFNSIINGMSYTNTSIDNPTAGNRVVTLTALSDDGGTANSGQNTATLSFASTVNVVGVNDAPTGSVTISGTAKQGQTLTASNSLADADGMGTVSYSWFSDGVAIGGATASTYTLTANEVGKLITAKANYTDGGNNATVVTSTASAAVASSGVAGDSVIALGSSGKLIAPVQVEGKWYYYWDRSGDGTSANTGSLNGGVDYANHNVLDGIFSYDINGNANTTVVNADGAYGTTDIYRYATFNGVAVALPTMNGGMALPQGAGTGRSGNLQNGTAATTDGTSSFDELMAIWDTRNGTGTGTNLSGIPTDWRASIWYWSATASSSGHLMASFDSGGVANWIDTGVAWVALQVISTPNTAPVLDAAQSPELPNIATTATAPTNGNTTAGVLVSSLVTGVSDADSGATQGIAITAAASGTVYYSLNGGTTWLSIASTNLSATDALLLAADADTRVYLQPTTLTAGTTSNALTFRAWDLTQHITEGVLADTTANGGKAQFSSATDTVSLTVAVPVAMSSVAISSATGIQNNTLNAGDVVTASVTYASAVTVSGTPTLSMVVGGTTVQATYDAVNSTATVLKFNYTVLPAQTDANGINIPVNALSLNGGSIIGSSNSVTAVVTNSLVSDNVSYLVDTTAPTATLTSTGTLGTTQSAVVQSTETGVAYLVNTSLSVSDVASITSAADAQWNSLAIGTVNTATNLSLSGLTNGTYKLYTADAAGNLSAVSGNSITVVKPIAAVNLVDISGGVGGFVINGAAASDYAGAAVSNAGDVNGDGWMDVIVGAYQADPAGQSIGGRSYVVFGSAANSPINLLNLEGGSSTQGFAINGYTASAYSGASVSAAGDLNGDGLADLLVSMIGPSATTAGKAFVVYGKATGSAINLQSLTTAGNGLGYVINGQAVGDELGTSVSVAGDVNGDGLADLIVGAYKASSNSGKSYVVFGSAGTNPINAADLATGTSTQGFVINGTGNSFSGFSVSAAGDVNGDGLADVLVGAQGASINTGKSYVVFGSASGQTINLADLDGGSNARGFVINGESQDDRNGISVSAAGDVNGDGLADVIVASRTALFNKGKSYVVFGKAGVSAVNLAAVASGNSTQGFVMVGELGGDLLGSQVSAAGDINGDGLADLLVGAFGADSAGGADAGKSYVVFGTSSGAVVNLANIVAGVGGFVINGVTANDRSGIAVSAAGDVNGDGFADLLVGADSAGGTGRAYVILGGTHFMPTVNFVDLVGNASDNTLSGSAAAETFMAGDGNDTLTGGGGADVMNGGKGNDTLVLNASNVAALAANFGSGGNTTQLARVDGGTGFDTLRLAQGGGNLDLTAIKNVDAMAGDGTSRVNSFERIDLGADSTANTLTIAARDVNDMAGFNLIRTGSVSADGNTWTNVSGTALSATTQFHQVVVDGGSNDVVNLKTGGTWVNAGTVNNGSSDYIVYQNASTRSQLIVKSGVTVNMNVAPVVLDVNRDGVLDYGQVTMDVNGDGAWDVTKWAGAQDGVLVWDKFADGLVHDNSQYAFSQYATTRYTNAAGQVLEPTDLQGLADAFDSNHDGVFNAADAKFAEFKVWQDANQNGVSDAGEVRSLADWGLTEINLTSDGVVRTPAAGVTEAGRTTATATDGTQVLVSDAGFAFSSLAYSATTVDGLGTHIDLLGSGMQLDLSRFIAQHGHVNEVDLTGTGANTIKLNLGDVLETPPLKLTGDADDAVLLNAGDWVNTGDVRTDSGYAYAVYNANSTQTHPQLWLEQHMTVLMI